MMAIALVTIREALRKKLLIAAFVLSVIYLLLYGTGLYYAGKELASGIGNNEMMKTMLYAQLSTMGLYLASFIISFLAIFSAIGTISAEAEKGILHAILARPIRRGELVLGKFLGYSSVIAIFGVFVFSAIAVLNNRLLGFDFNNIPLAVFLFILQSILLLAVSIMGSTFLPTLGNGVAVFLLYSVALIGGFVEQIGAIVNSQKTIDVGIVTSLIMPSDAIYRKLIHTVLPPSINIIPQALGPFGSTSTPSNAMVLYALLHIGIILAAAIYIFNKRDI